MAHLIKLYEWIVKTESNFLDNLDESTIDAGDTYWKNLDKSCLVFLMFMVVISIVMCIGYFTTYNKMPGRHYRPTHWLVFYIATILTSSIGTGLIGYFLAKPTIKGSGWLLFDIAVGNLLYSFLIFGALSIIWWLFLPTNAYRLLKKRI